VSKVSGPLIDRIDIHVEVPPVPWKQLRSEQDGMTSQQMRDAVIIARATQTARFAAAGSTTTNASMTTRQVREFCKLDEPSEALLKQAVTELGLSARAHDKILRIARTLADMEGIADLTVAHIAEAVQYRRLDRKL
jgi:magnesium chelatase family protein